MCAGCGLAPCPGGQACPVALSASGESVCCPSASPPTPCCSRNQLPLPCVSCRLESGGSDASTERASARARREAREARLATLSSRAEEDGGRGYRKVGSDSGPPARDSPAGRLGHRPRPAAVSCTVKTSLYRALRGEGSSEDQELWKGEQSRLLSVSPVSPRHTLLGRGQ